MAEARSSAARAPLPPRFEGGSPAMRRIAPRRGARRFAWHLLGRAGLKAESLVPRCLCLAFKFCRRSRRSTNNTRPGLDCSCRPRRLWRSLHNHYCEHLDIRSRPTKRRLGRARGHRDPSAFPWQEPVSSVDSFSCALLRVVFGSIQPPGWEVIVHGGRESNPGTRQEGARKLLNYQDFGSAPAIRYSRFGNTRREPRSRFGPLRR